MHYLPTTGLPGRASWRAKMRDKNHVPVERDDEVSSPTAASTASSRPSTRCWNLAEGRTSLSQWPPTMAMIQPAGRRAGAGAVTESPAFRWDSTN